MGGKNSFEPEESFILMVDTEIKKYGRKKNNDIIDNNYNDGDNGNNA